MGSLAAPLVSAGIQFGASKLLGGGSKGKAPRIDFKPGKGVTNLSGGGLTTTFDATSGAVSTARGPNRQNALDNLLSTIQNQVNELGGLRSQVNPGFGRLTESRVSALNNARTRAIGNLRENLGRRRVLGSSFGEDAIARTEREFGQAEGEVRAQSFLEELDANVNLTNQVFNTYKQVFQTVFSEMNLEAGQSVQLATLAQDLTAKNNAISAQLAAASAGLKFESDKGAGKFAGGLIEPIASAAGKEAGGLFSGGFGSLFGGGGGAAQSLPITGPGLL